MGLIGQGAVFARLATNRWHLQHGPIDLLVEVDAPAAVRDRCIAECWAAVQDILPRLVTELAALRRPAWDRAALQGPVARRMALACEPYAEELFITPMAAVAGSVADELIGVFHRADVSRAFINNGGDIALHLAPGASYQVGVWSRVERLPGESPSGEDLDGRFLVDAAMPVRGVATSGWRGRSFSLGVADSVTVLAASAAAADAAATLIANAVNCDAPGIARAPASQLKDDSDLGDRLVTVEVPALPPAVIAAALARGRLAAERWRDRGLIHCAALFLQGSVEVVRPRNAVAAALHGARVHGARMHGARVHGAPIAVLT
jgi:ApbE superfamily uncharacterized protein (UPF0280 family)